MAGGNKAPSSIAEAYSSILQSLAAAMTAPDAGPAIPFLIEMQKAIAGQMQKGNQPPKPGGPPGGAPGGPPGGGPPGTSLGQLQGQPPQGPSAGPQGGPSGSGISSEDLRRMTGANAGTAG